MNQQIKQKWIAALRSGEYEQDTSYLRTNHGFCCLGVLTDLYLKEINKEWIQDKMFPVYHYDEEAKILPLKVMAWAGLIECNPFLDTGHSLSHYNDNLGYNFEQIADLIEENL